MSRSADLLRSPVFRLVGYFALLSITLVGITWFAPWFARLLVPAPPGSEAFPGLVDSVGTPSAALFRSVLETLALGLMALLGALVFAVPVVWIYTLIMRQTGYDRAFVRMLTALPVVVAGVVQVVRGDLALAFALAGIVAAVRFRTTVKDLQNAVFAFAAIGIGLAAGTGSFTLAGAIAFSFSALSFGMWKLRIGEVQPSLELSHGGVPLAEALVPGETHRAVVVGDESVAAPVETDELDDLSDQIDRLADYVRADALRKKKKYNTLLLAYTRDEGAADERVQEVLDEHARRWVHVDTIQRNGETVVLEYLLRLKKKVKVGRMIDRLAAREGGTVLAAELKPIKGLRKRLT